MARRTDQGRGKAALREAYVDTSGFIAFLDKSDSYHTVFKRLFASPPALVTSALVIAEGHGWFLRRYDRHRAVQFLAFIEALTMTVQPFDTGELSRTRRILARFGDQNLTLADTHGLAIMAERRNSICFSTDRHMGLSGVKLAIAPEKLQ
jgi:predicted nucleic acid-binding protein